ncbi:nicotinate-nucleotide--dimethylbenzimidazole phosphoribosyltransferase [Zhengella mangrovi]|uniref:Nicotinate-nucleotide--dimethylbenzimidazole phosphoribosyltransferase n=1 Tax=Zhengella mangrovi TaxID=1982044 RepID=A0A2G1QHB6_9HYPH|nr:nicotinate-nucleotide--dimethylbenzimidazole phosphoribosyltransferase [Zhengella mangrovi]PHP64937.1 nicotinate-nucleotide--dimethylbenzimidazole phosphoribosyltransferase [Zhengella mangrovi]
MANTTPFDDFRALIGNLPNPDKQALAEAGEARKALLAGEGLGRIGTIAQWYSGWRGNARQPVMKPLTAIFAGNHGFVAANRGPWSLAETQRRVDLCAAGGGMVNQVCEAQNISLKILDLALEHPTGDITVEAALDERQCAATMAFGMEAIMGGVDLLALGDIGAGNGAVAGALMACAFGGKPADWAGDPATPEGQARRAVIEAAFATHGDALADPLEALRRVGGREFAAMAGAILAARMERVPVVLGGIAPLAAAAVLWKVNPLATGHCVLADLSGEPGEADAARRLGLKPLLDFGIGLGEGASAALGAGLVRTALACQTGMAAKKNAAAVPTH